MSIFLETKRLRLTTPTLQDFDDLYALQCDPDVMRYIGKGKRTKTEVMTGLEQAILHFEKYGFALCSVFEKASGKFVGRAGLIYLAYDDNQSDIEIGYAFAKNSWRNGYASEVAQALIEWGFKNLTVDKFVAVIDPLNEQSRKVLEKVGMRFLGHRHYWGKDVVVYDIHKNAIDYNEIKILEAALTDYPTIQNMARFYVYDMSEYLGMEDGWAIPENGLYECIDFRKYWDDKHAHPFLIYYKNEMVGFVIVDTKGSDQQVNFNMAQFFILRKFKAKGIGRFVAHQIFEKFRGVWEIMVIPGNEGAYRFWRTIIGDFTKGVFTEYSRKIAHFKQNSKNIFRFDSNLSKKI